MKTRAAIAARAAAGIAAKSRAWIAARAKAGISVRAVVPEALQVSVVLVALLLSATMVTPSPSPALPTPLGVETPSHLPANLPALATVIPMTPGPGARPAPPAAQVVAPGDTAAGDTLSPDDGSAAPTATAFPDDSVSTDAEPLTAEQAALDETIRSRLQAVYDRVGSLQDIEVDVEAGVVRLRGRALTPDARQQAVELARNTDGVIFVEDQLRVVTDLGRRLEPAVNRLREYALGAVAFVPLLFVAVFVVFLFLLLGSWIARWDGPHLRVARSAFTRNLIRQLIRLVFGLAGLLVALELLDATALVGAVLGAAGIFGLALGFAFKDIVENHLAGVMLSLRQPFAPNDHIVVGSHEGKVVRLTARETILMTLAGNHVRIPNGEIYRSVLTNYTRNPRRRFEFNVSVGTDEELLAAQEAGLAALGAMPGVMEDPPPKVHVAELGDSWVTLRFFGWVDQVHSDFARVRSEAIRLVKRALESAGVSMPSPEYEVVLRRSAAARAEAEGRAAVEEDEAGGRGRPPGPRQADAAPPPRPTAGEAPSEQQDVSVDRTLDEQIAEDRRTSDEDDLLTGGSEAGSDPG